MTPACSSGSRNPSFFQTLLFGVTLIHSLVINGDSKVLSKNKKLCETEGCVKTAARIMSYMNLSVNPCDDFYRYSCGRYLANTFIPDNKPAATIIEVIEDHLKLQLRTIFEEPLNDSDIQAFKIVRNFYKLCMNESQIEDRGLEKIKSMLHDMGGWPVLECCWDDCDFKWENLIYQMCRLGFNPSDLISFSVTIDLMNGNKSVIEIGEARLHAPYKNLIKGVNDDIVKEYLAYMTDIAILLGADEEVAQENMSDCLDFEIQLARLMLPPEEKRNITKLYNPMTIPELNEIFPSISWEEYLATLLGPSVQLRENETVIVTNPEFLRQLDELLQNTDSRVIANFLLWGVVDDSVGYLTKQLRDRKLKFVSVKTGVSVMVPRWQECVENILQNIPFAPGALYVRKYFKETSKSNVDSMIHLLRKEMYKLLNHSDWMDNTTQNTALDKAKFMKTYTGYPQELLNNSKLEEFFEGLRLSDEYLSSFLCVNRFMMDFQNKQLTEPVNKSDWKNHADTAMINAYYNSADNSITFPAGILQDPFFSSDRPHYMNFGSIGSVIGHEITHGFDDVGSQFDKYGNMVNWWDPVTKEKYENKTRCIIEQYGNYSVPEFNMTVNGVLTQGENVADNGGFKEAYNAYQAWRHHHRNRREPALPGLERFSPSQMFWISAATTYCSLYRPSYLKKILLEDPHSPGQFRVLGSLSNSEKFAKDFKCPVGSKMNPVKKCVVW